MQHQAHGRDEERGHSLPVHQFEDTRQTGCGAILALGHRHRQRTSPEQRFVVHVERKGYGNARPVGPSLGSQFAPGTRYCGGLLDFFRSGIDRDGRNAGRLRGSLSARRSGQNQNRDECRLPSTIFHNVGKYGANADRLSSNGRPSAVLKRGRSVDPDQYSFFIRRIEPPMTQVTFEPEAIALA